MATPWMPSPYGTPTPVIDAVMRTPPQVPAQTPVPIPGLMPLPLPQVGVPQFQAPYLGVPPTAMPYLGVPQFQAPYLGVPPTPVPFLGVPQFQAPYLGVPPLPFPQMGIHPAQAAYLSVPQFQAPYLGVPQFQAPYLGVPPLPLPQMGIHPAQALGFGTQMTPWAITGHAGPAISPVAAMLLSQLGLKEAVSRISDNALKERIINGVNEAIERSVEGFAGMAFHPWMGPGAQLMTYPIATELALIAHRYQDGAVRNELLNIAGQILQKSTAHTGGEGGRRHQ